jgi:prepilin-type N-terminal cleavage/methylation domain-containing protein
MRGFTLLELLVVLFIITTVAFIAFPNLWSEMAKDDKITLASTLRNLREEAITTKKEIFFTVDFRERQFRIKGAKGMPKDESRIIDMDAEETWEIFIPSRGTIKEGEVIVAFTPSVQEELIALYLTRNGKDSTIVLNNLSGEVEIEEGKRNFDE